MRKFWLLMYDNIMCPQNKLNLHYKTNLKTYKPSKPLKTLKNSQNP